MKEKISPGTIGIEVVIWKVSVDKAPFTMLDCVNVKIYMLANKLFAIFWLKPSSISETPSTSYD